MRGKPEYTVDTHLPDRARLSGIMRLPDPQTYDDVLGSVQAALQDGRAYTIDISGLTFLNSSGIRALAGLVLESRRTGQSLSLVGAQAVPWHRKTATALKDLYPGLNVTLTE